MKVYVLKFDWSTEDCADVEITVYGSYNKAYDAFLKLVENEKNPELSWVGEAFDENGKIKHSYELDYLFRRSYTDETEVYWIIENKNDWYQRSAISIEIKELL